MSGSAREMDSSERVGLEVELQMAAVPEPDYDETNWWRNEGGLIAVFEDYLKLAYYCIKYQMTFLISEVNMRNVGLGDR